MIIEKKHAKMKLASLKKKLASGEQAACYRQFSHHDQHPGKHRIMRKGFLHVNRV